MTGQTPDWKWPPPVAIFSPATLVRARQSHKKLLPVRGVMQRE
jgi:hypothetical protein